MNKVYMLKIEHYADDDERQEIRLFKTLKKAKQVLKELIDEELANVPYTIVEKSEIDFYAENDEENITMYIVEKEIEE